jgi:hypothetical protein
MTGGAVTAGGAVTGNSSGVGAGAGAGGDAAATAGGWWGSAPGAAGSAGAATSVPNPRRNPAAATINATPHKATTTPAANEQRQAGREKGRMTPPGLGRCGKRLLHTRNGGRINISFPRKVPAPGYPALAAVVAAWPTLPDPIRRAVLALVGSA